MQNAITQLFGIQYPIIQAGMIWASGWRLASAVSNAGGLGIIGAGSMYPDVLKEHIAQLTRFKESIEKDDNEYLMRLIEDANKIRRIIK